MNCNFKFYNPTTIYFGSSSLKYLEKELKQVGQNILLVYGGGSIKKIGLYNQVLEILSSSNKNVIDDGGVLSNPSVDRVKIGCQKVIDNQVDFILAIGGGSVIDYAKAVASCAYAEGDWWQRYFVNMEKVNNRILNYGCLLTVSGTGSEMNSCSVISNESEKLKIGRVFGDKLYPKFSIINPEWMKSVPKIQLFSGIYDSFTHLMEQYFSTGEIMTTDYMIEGLMRCIYENSYLLLKDINNDSAFSNLVWASTWALNTLFSRGRSGDWMLHMLGQAIGAVTNANHGLTLSAISIPYYTDLSQNLSDKFKRFSLNVFNDEDGIEYLAKCINDMGLVSNLSALGVSSNQIDAIVDSTIILDNGFREWNQENIKSFLLNCL